MSEHKHTQKTCFHVDLVVSRSQHDDQLRDNLWDEDNLHWN